MAALTPEQRALAAQGKFGEIKLTPAQKAAADLAKPASAPAPAAAPAASEAPAAPAQAAEPSPAPSATSETAGSEGESPEPGEDPSAPKGKRFRFASEVDQAIASIAKSKGVSLLEAARIYEGQPPQKEPEKPASAPAATPAHDPVVQDIDGKITTARERITALTEQRMKAADDLDNAKMLSLGDEIAELKADVRFLENEKQGHLRNREVSERTRYENAANASLERVMAVHPELKERDGMQRLAFDAYVERALKDPARAQEFADPSWPERLATEFASKVGLKPAGSAPVSSAAAAQPKPQTVTKAQPTQVTQPQGARMLTGSDGKSSSPSQLTREQVLDRVRTDPEARRQAVRNFSSSLGRSR